MAADALTGNPHLTAPKHVSVPPPSSLCPCCGNVEIKSAQYLQRGQHMVFFACADGHEWLTRWGDRQGVA
jgi:hypothetical protein